MKKTGKKSLKLTRETIRALYGAALADVVAGLNNTVEGLGLGQSCVEKCDTGGGNGTQHQ